VISRTRLASRFAWAGVIAFGVGITVLGIWSTSYTLRATDATQRLVKLSDGWQQARYWIAEEETLERKYRIERARHDAYYHDWAVATLTQTVLRLRPISSVRDNAKIDALLDANAKYVLAMRAMFRAVDRGDQRRIDAIHDAIDPTYDRIEHIAVAEEALYHRSAYLALARLQKTQRFVATGFPVLAFFGMLAIGACGGIIREYRRKADELVAAELARFERAALDDALTGLGNNRAFQAGVVERADADAQEACHLALIDVDHFKLANDRFGHLHGDNVLRGVGSLLADLPATARAYRVGGDEFAVVYRAIDLPSVLADLGSLQKRASARLLGNTLSIGVASAGVGDTSVATLHECADVALYEAKHRGRNKIVAYEPHLLESSTSLRARRVALDRFLASASAGDVAFQPIWTFYGGTLLGYEALSSFEGYFRSPDEATTVAERLDRAHELDACCLRSIGKQCPTGFDGLLFVNISPMTLLHGDAADRALSELSRTAGIPAGRIVVELTETIALVDEALACIAGLRARGYRVALDDTGSSNAGLAVLAKLPLDVVKIDGSLLAALDGDQRARAIVSGVMLVVRSLGCSIVMKGVETREHIRLCGQLAREHGLTEQLALQGNGLGGPSSSATVRSVARHPALRQGAGTRSLDETIEKTTRA